MRRAVQLLNAASTIRKGLELEVLPVLTPLSSEGVYSWEHVSYTGPHNHDASHEAAPKHTLDVYVPSDPFPRPLLPVAMFVHGGAWQRGDKQHLLNTYGNFGIACARAGAVGVVINYRLAPEVRHPGQVRDVAAAVGWVKHSIQQFGGDPSRVVLCGHSAGAHLCMLAAAQPRWFYEAGVGDDPSSALCGVVGMSGIYNVPRLGQTPLGPYLVEPAFGTDPAVWREASPVHYTSASSPLHHTPLLLLNAASDFHLEQDTEELVQRLHSQRPSHLQDLVRHEVVEDTNHASIIAAFGQEGDASTAVVTRFIQQVTSASDGQ